MIVIDESMSKIYDYLYQDLKTIFTANNLDINNFGIDFIPIEGELINREISCTNPRLLIETLKANEKLTTYPIIKWLIKKLEV